MKPVDHKWTIFKKYNNYSTQLIIDQLTLCTLLSTRVWRPNTSNLTRTNLYEHIIGVDVSYHKIHNFNGSQNFGKVISYMQSQHQTPVRNQISPTTRKLPPRQTAGYQFSCHYTHPVHELTKTSIWQTTDDFSSQACLIIILSCSYVYADFFHEKLISNYSWYAE
jgi:hypothetical protein